MAKTILNVNNLEFRYRSEGDKFLLEIPNFSLMTGERTAILGKSGSGKTTFLKICAMLERNFTGRVSLFDCDLRENPHHSKALIKRTAFLFQESIKFSGNVFFNAAVGLQIRNETQKEISRKVGNLLEILKISEHSHKNINEISSGQLRRVCLARALVLQPEILFLDEPFYSLDQLTKNDILKDINEYIRKINCAVMLVTHDPDEAAALCEKTVTINCGKIK